MIHVRKKLYLIGLLFIIGLGYLVGAHSIANHDHKNCYHRHPKAHEVSKFLFTFSLINFVLGCCTTKEGWFGFVSV